MSSQVFQISNFKSPIIANRVPNRVDLAIGYERDGHPKDLMSRVFFIKEHENKQFWNIYTHQFCNTRVRPNDAIGDWNVGRLIQIAFLERLLNIDAKSFTIRYFLSVFNDDSWNPIFGFIDIDAKESLD